MSICFGTKTPEEKEGIKNSREIDEMLKQQGKYLKEEIKLLLLGPGESGKSTVFKQMKIIQQNGGFSSEELMSFKHVIHANCVSQMRVILQAASNLQQPFGTQEAFKAAQKLLQLPNMTALTPEVADMIKILWADSGIRETYKLRGKKYQLNDTANYFFDHAERFAKTEYMPTQEDVLRARVRSTGIEEAEFNFDGLTFTMVDVGGQRSERRKWIHCFDCVTAILFCAALSDYDQTLREDGSQNRMAEAILLFDEVANSKWFKENSVILFLNKVDLFDEKVKYAPITVFFKEYTDDPTDAEKAKVYIRDKFQEKVRAGTVYTHFTCALNTKNIEFVIKSVKDTLLRGTLSDMGVLPI